MMFEQNLRRKNMNPWLKKNATVTCSTSKHSSCQRHLEKTAIPQSISLNCVHNIRTCLATHPGVLGFLNPLSPLLCGSYKRDPFKSPLEKQHRAQFLRASPLVSLAPLHNISADAILWQLLVNEWASSFLPNVKFSSRHSQYQSRMVGWSKCSQSFTKPQALPIQSSFLPPLLLQLSDLHQGLKALPTPLCFISSLSFKGTTFNTSLTLLALSWHLLPEDLN